MEDSKRASRRRHSSELKTKVLAECSEPAASVAQVALANGLNANLVHKWRRRAEGGDEAVAHERRTAAFIPLTLPRDPAPVARDIRVELRRGAIAVNVDWPLAAAGECASWLRELLK